MRGKFITFEGGEGSGKSTQIELLAQYLREHKIDVITSKEPGGTAIGKNIRAILVQERPEELDAISEAMLYYADRRHHINYKILPALEKGKWVISDRFADSTTAYQYYGYNKRVAKHILDELYLLAAGSFKPNLTIILDIEPELGLKRSMCKAEGMAVKETHFENIDISFHQNLRNGYLEIAKAEPERCVVLNANKSIEELHKDIVKIVTERLNVE